MEHGQSFPQSTANPHQDPGDFVAEEARLKKANPNYIGVFVVLGILTAIEIGITVLFHAENGAATVGRVPILLFLTVAKALLVILYYMHLKFDSRIYSFFFGAGVLAFAIPFVLALTFLMSPPQLTSARHAEGNGGENGGEVRPTPNPNAGPPITIKLESKDFEFIPNVEAATNGQGVRIELHNLGSVEHNFVFPTKTIAEDPEPWATNDGKLIAKAQPGSTGKGGFTAPAPGEYAFYCNVPGHAALGMHGVFTVK